MLEIECANCQLEVGLYVRDAQPYFQTMAPDEKWQLHQGASSGKYHIALSLRFGPQLRAAVTPLTYRLSVEVDGAEVGYMGDTISNWTNRKALRLGNDVYQVNVSPTLEPSLLPATVQATATLTIDHCSDCRRQYHIILVIPGSHDSAQGQRFPRLPGVSFPNVHAPIVSRVGASRQT